VRRTVGRILTEYGAVGVTVYLTIFFVVLFAAWGAIAFGWKPESVSGNVGAFTAAYLTTKVTYPLRIATTIAVTPLASRCYHDVSRRFKAREP
jgi:hypothetical protein